jgi:hypothetical protein
MHTKSHTLSGFEPGSSVDEAEAMTTAPRRQGRSADLFSPQILERKKDENGGGTDSEMIISFSVSKVSPGQTARLPTNDLGVQGDRIGRIFFCWAIV